MNHSSVLTLSVVIPAYNEEAVIEKTLREVQKHVLTLIPGAEVIVVNDGSRDRTGLILDKLAAENPSIRVIHQRNGGHGRALRTGLDAARGEYVFLIDSDCQIPLEAFGTAWQSLGEGDAIFGLRAERHDPKLRLFLSVLIRLALQLLFRAPLRDANVPFKILRRSVWLEARQSIPEDTLAPSLFLALYMRRRGFKIIEREVRHCMRATGVVSIRRWKLLKFCARAFFQLLAFRRRLQD